MRGQTWACIAAWPAAPKLARIAESRANRSIAEEGRSIIGEAIEALEKIDPIIAYLNQAIPETVSFE